MGTIEIELYNILKGKIGGNETKELIKFIDSRSEQKQSEASKLLATKEDISNVKEDISNVRIEIRDSKVDIIKWVFAFFITLALMIVGLYLK